jgi:leader peptidase (prepilin peptidase)/N-methyltransferase
MLPEPRVEWILIAAVVGLVAGPLLALLAGRVRRPAQSPGVRVALAASIAASILFGIVVCQFRTPLEIAAYLVVAAAAIVLSIVDLQDHRLPDVVVLPTLAVAVALLAAASVVKGEHLTILGVVGGAIGMFAIYFMLALIAPSGIGMGDVKLSAVIGAAAGYLGLTTWLGALVGGFIVGAVVSLIALATKRVSMKSQVPFGPAMLIGLFMAILMV